MKKSKILSYFCFVAVLFAAMSAAGAKTVKIINPWVDKTNTSNLFIDAVELGPDSTVLTMHTYNYLRRNINIQPGARLVLNGKSYPLRSADGIELGKNIGIPALGDSIFKLSFESLPKKTKTFDFIEGDGDDYFRLEGIHTDKTFDSLGSIDNLRELPKQKWEKGTAVLKGKILNYDSSGEDSSVSVYPRSSLGRQIDKNIGVSTINPDGTFEVELPVYQSYQPCFFTAPGFYGLIYLSPDMESCVTIDTDHRRSGGHNGKDGSVIFTGANDELNNQLALNIGHDMVWDSFFNNIPRDRTFNSASEYKSEVLRHEAKRKDKIKKLPFTPKIKHLMNVEIENDLVLALLYRMQTQKFGKLDSAYYDFYRDIDVNDPELMWASSFDSFINTSYYLSPDILRIQYANISPDYYSYLIKNHIVTGNDADLALSLISNNYDSIPKEIVDEFAGCAVGRVMYYRDSLDLKGPERAEADKLMDRLKGGEFKKYNDVRSNFLNWIFNLNENGHELSVADAADIPFENDLISGIRLFLEDNDSIISDFNTRYEDSFQQWNFEKDIDKAIENFNRIYGKESSIMDQLFAAYAYTSYIDRRNTLPESYIEPCRKRLPDLFFDFVMVQNDAMAKVLERVKSNILEMKPENSGDEVLKEIAEKYRGKVIYIDIWAVWCSPCLYAITEIQPEKKNYSDNVVFMYLADETSPQIKWEEKIKSIEGEHMRLSQNQMQDIMTRFSFDGYPSYIVIGKDGSVAYSGFLHGLENIKKILDEEIAK